MRIQHNILSMNAYRNYTNNTSALGKNLEKLSSGYKINRAGDDAAGLAISEKMRAQIKGLDAAQKNVKDGISFVKTAEGAMQEIQDMLSRMKYLATQSANGTYEDTVDRKALQDEVDSLLEEIDRIADSANFNDIYMLNGGAGNAAGGITANDITAPTATSANFSDGANGTKNATTDFDFAGVAFKADGDVKVSFGGKDYTVAVTKDMTADKFAEAFVAAYNKDKLTDADAGDFTAAIDGTTNTKVVFTSAQQDAVGDATLSAALAKAPTIAPAEAAKAKAAAGADAANGPTFTENTTGDKLVNYDLASIDLSGVKGLDAEGDVQIAYDGATQKLTVSVGGKDYSVVLDNTNAGTKGAGAGNKTLELFTAGDANGTGADGKITVKTVATTTKLGSDSTNAEDIAKAAVGKAAPAADDNAGGAGNYSITLQIGDTAAEYNQMVMNIKSMKTDSIGVDGLKINTRDLAAEAIDTIKTAINTVSATRGQLGAYQNRLEHTANNLSVMTENIQDAESTIRDTDVADEMMAYTKNNILIQSAQAMLAQANAVPQGVLQLLQ